MTLEEFAHLILFGNTLEEKLAPGPPLWSISKEEGKPVEVPTFTGRPVSISKPGKAAFPSIHRLNEPTERGKVLHFFANHELLAMELMALMLLRFPDAPTAFRRGIAAIIQEEQGHLRLYISRMRELGIDFGDLPVNDYFWNSMKSMKSPLDFTVQMSLTFEQANLDFSLFFMNAVAQTGDQATASILEKVFQEEIGHVKHGVTWFNRWRENSATESDWQSYLKLLPPPLNPQRAKGYEFCEDARRQAGLSETFIRELKIHSGSKGRPPVLWFYNPHCDSEISRGRPGFTPSEGARKTSEDLEAIPIFLCQNQDLVLVRERPSSNWIESLQKVGIETPEFAERQDSIENTVRAIKIGGIEPWGWSPEVFEAFRPLQSRLAEMDGGNAAFCHSLFSHQNYSQTGIGQLFSKSWSTRYFQKWLTENPEMNPHFGKPTQVGISCTTWEDTLLQIQKTLQDGFPVMIKAPFGTSGMQVKRLNHLNLLVGPRSGPLVGWIKNILKNQGAIVIEPYLNRLFDLSIQMEIHENRIHLLEVRQFITGKRNEYRGTYLGKKMPGFSTQEFRFFHSVLPEWHRFLRDLGNRLKKEGYRGPAGVDAFLWKDQNGSLKLKPLVEINPRWTMGRVALELEKHLAHGLPGLWAFLPLKEIQALGFDSIEQYSIDLQKKYPPKIIQSAGGLRIESGVVFTNDPTRAQSVLTVLATLPNPDLIRFF